MRGAPIALPSFATALFKWFFDCGRAVQCMLPLGAGRFMHLIVLYSYQEADSDDEQLAQTDQLFGAALCELSVVGCGQPCMLVGDFNVEPLPWQKGFRLGSGLILRSLGPWLLVCALLHL